MVTWQCGLREGEKVEPFGPNPKGTMTFDSGGRFSIIVTRSDLPKFASNNRELGTSEENKAAVQGSIAYFGSYNSITAALTAGAVIFSARDGPPRRVRQCSGSLCPDVLRSRRGRPSFWPWVFTITL